MIAIDESPLYVERHRGAFNKSAQGKQAYLGEEEEKLWGSSVANVLCSSQKASSVTTRSVGLRVVVKGDGTPPIAWGVGIPSHGTCG